MCIFSMLAESFAMIAGNNNDCVLIGARFLQSGNEVGEGGVGVGDFTVVEVLRVFLGEGWRRLVRIMRIVEVYPHKARIRSDAVEPSFGVLDDRHGAAFDAAPTLLGVGLGWEVVVEVKAAIQAGSERAAIENDRSDEGRGLVSLLLQKFGPGDVLRRERNSEVGDAVDARQEASQESWCARYW